MNKTKKNIIVAFGIAGVLFVLPADAQFFDKVSASKSSVPSERSEDELFGIPSTIEASDSSENIIPAEKTTAMPREMYGKDNTEEKQMYYSTIGQVTIASEDKDADDELIMLYMKNFNIYRSPSGQTRCSVRFAILTTLPVKLSNISYRLKWPKMETTLSFNDVEPSVEYHYDYALLGEGCYNMDRQPNIIVNRCRAKGMTQKDCAAKIRWITAVNR